MKLAKIMGPGEIVERSLSREDLAIAISEKQELVLELVWIASFNCVLLVNRNVNFFTLSPSHPLTFNINSSPSFSLHNGPRLCQDDVLKYTVIVARRFET